ncbi:HNH endonuclease signature motif containing protein [Arthrobacter sp. MDT2-16]
MATAPIESVTRAGSPLESARATLADCARDLTRQHSVLSRADALRLVVDVEQVSRVVDHLQILVARLADEHDLADHQLRGPTLVPASVQAQPGAASPPDRPDRPAARLRDCAEFLRTTLGIGEAEARRRLNLAEVVLPGLSPTGAPTPAPLEALGDAVGSCVISSRAATIIVRALKRVHAVAAPEQLMSMEHHLTLQAAQSDEDLLRVLARRWESVLDQDGQEPTEKILRARQGVFLKGRRHGLHLLEIGATDEQFEHLVTVMNSATNPRRAVKDPASPAGPADDGGGPVATAVDAAPTTRAQDMLEGLVAACRIALSGDGLPATGGHRPQVMVTIDYRDLLEQMQRAGSAVFSQQISARTIRKLACEAEIIPVVLGSRGQVLDVGRAQRLFPPHLRRALVARDRGCAFPDCSIPASWCEAHHLRPWSSGGRTSIDNGVLLCSRHHHAIHQGTWSIESRSGVPWFLPPVHRRGTAGPRRNLNWQAGQAVDIELARQTVPPT